MKFSLLQRSVYFVSFDIKYEMSCPRMTEQCKISRSKSSGAEQVVTVYAGAATFPGEGMHH